jgi:tetratricopeptide (TPR) repeat protein
MATASLTLSQAFDIAVAAYRAGKLDAAEQICRQILGADREHLAAINLCAVLLNTTGRHDRALAACEYALALRPDFVEALINRGVALLALDRFDDALASHDRALALEPDRVDALTNRGNVLTRLERHAEALGSYDRALALEPDHVDALTNRGDVLRRLRRFEQALPDYDRALALQPDHVAALNNRGLTLRDLQQCEAALASFDRVLAVRPQDPQALTNRGAVLHDLKRYAEAVASYDRALDVRPDDAETLTNRGLALQALDRHDEALASHERALLVAPENASALNNRGVALYRLKRLAQALASYDSALAARPGYAQALSNRGVVLEDLGRFEEAAASYELALAAQPDDADAHFLLGMSWLRTGDFDRGWREYEWRWRSDLAGIAPRHFMQPRWRGGDEIAGRTILLHGEQGFGDAIQFCRYAPLVAARGARVILEVAAPLRALMGGLSGVAQVITRGDPLPAFDLHCPLLSLPLAFATRLGTIPSAVPYLRMPMRPGISGDPRLQTAQGPRIGLAWSGNPAHRKDRDRSIGLRMLAPLLQHEGTFVSLQKDVPAADAELLAHGDILHCGDELVAFSDTAARVAPLDLVISVDTSVAHLAGALGKPVWLLLPHVPDWRWLLHRNDSPWYPTARLFRQDATGVWDGVVARVCDALGQWI